MPLEKTHRKNRLLVIHQGALGDIVCILPHIAAAKNAMNADADFFCQAPYLALLKKLGIAKQGTGIESRAMAGLFSENPPQQALGLLAGYSAAIYFGKSPEFEASLKRVIPKVFSFAPRPAPDQRIHIGQALAMQMIKANLIKEPAPPWPAPGALRQARNGPVLLHPGSGSPRKCWAAANFAAIYKKAAMAGLKAAFVLGPADDALQKELADLGVLDGDIVVNPSLVDLWEALLECRAFVGNDSGVTHLAALAGAPFVAIFGPCDPLRWAPQKSGKGKGMVLREITDCLPCFELEGRNCDEPICLETPVEKVWQALMEVVESQ